MKTVWIAFTFMAACVGIIVGTSMRSRQDTGSSLFSTSELLALRSGNGSSSEDAPWFPATAYYDQVRRIVEAEYVEPITNNTKMARSSLRYLLRSLGDPETRYYDPDQWRAYTGRLEGRFEGIGADVLAQEKMTQSGAVLPVVVLSLAPNGPAAKAGLQAGDVVETIDGRWVASRSLFDELQAASDSFTAGKISRARYDEIWQGIRDRSERMMSVEEALERLNVGTGALNLEVRRAGQKIAKKIELGEVEVPSVEREGNHVRVRVFGPGSGSQFAEAVDDKASLVIDLRGNPGGSFDEMKQALSAVLGGGAFAQIRTDPKAPLEKLSLENDTTTGTKPSMTVLVDSGTAREAEVFAAALRDVGGAKIEGGPMAGLARKVQRFALPDGSGYAVTSGHYYDLKGNSLVREDPQILKARQKAAEAKQ